MKKMFASLKGPLLELAIVLAVIAFLPRISFAGGASTCELGISTGTAFVQCAVNNGAAADLTLYSVVIETGAAADSVVCFDSGSISGLIAGNDGANVSGALPAPRIGFASVAATNTTTPEPMPSVPVNAVNGIACAKTNANARARIKFVKH